MHANQHPNHSSLRREHPLRESLNQRPNIVRAPLARLQHLSPKQTQTHQHLLLLQRKTQRGNGTHLLVTRNLRLRDSLGGERRAGEFGLEGGFGKVVR